MLLLSNTLFGDFTHITLDNILLVGSILLFASLLASHTTKYGVPTLLLFLFIGMLAGENGPGGIVFNDPKIAKFIGAFALSFILFSGGLETKKQDIQPVLWHGISLSTLGVIITAVSVGLFVAWIAHWSIVEGLLVGSIVSSTDAAAVFSILRSRSIGLKRQLKPLLELESGSNDPMAYILTISFTFLLANKEASVSTLLFMFFKQMILGGVIGYGMGLLMHKVFNWIKLEFEGLYSVLLITFVLFIFSFTDFIGGNAFLAVYLSAYVLGNLDFIHKKSLTKHFDGQAWLMQIILFITLGLLVTPKQLIPYLGIGLLISAFLIVIARPLSVFLALSFFRMHMKDKLFVSWVGLRGAVPIVLATYPLLAGVSKASVIFNVVFFISITSVLIQGTTLPLVAKWLKLTVPMNLKRKSVIDLEMAWGTKSIYKAIPVDASFHCIGKSIVDLKLPDTIIIALIERKNKFFFSDGATKIMNGDVLYVMADNEKAIENLYACLTA
ncbi:potassium/proton antiporter [Microbacter margulisiae]|uniref:potassium/proton antiporter n=1 Tax=Microbacter margulisiae TaxID=1350067 RepID=UPI00161C03E3|nr:potassium/proton antiporter [Microbacter margulisiae]